MPTNIRNELNAEGTETEGPSAPLADQVFALLHTWIVTGKIPPGARLRVRDIAAMAGTSVMPVRDAIRRVIESGLAVHEPYKGARVRVLEIGELENAYDARILIESACARLGAERADAALADRMQAHWSMLQEAARSGDVVESLSWDEKLLDELYSAACNDVMVEIIHGLWDLCRPYRVIWASGSGAPEDVSHWRYKPELIDAVRANDGDLAEEILRESYVSARDSLRDRIEGVPAEGEGVGEGMSH